jgi:argininosuccinate synthase
VRFEVGYYSLKPDIKVIAPWREWDLNSRTKLIAYAGARTASRACSNTLTRAAAVFP